VLIHLTLPDRNFDALFSSPVYQDQMMAGWALQSLRLDRLADPLACGYSILNQQRLGQATAVNRGSAISEQYSVWLRVVTL
jgi:hypothetical protein